MEFRYKKTSLVDEKLIIREGKKLTLYIKKIAQNCRTKNYYFPESSLLLPLDKSHLEEVKKLSKRFDVKKLKYIIIVGIGGSNLGTKAIYDALFGQYDTLEPSRFPKILFSDTVDTEWQNKCIKLLQQEIRSQEELVFVCISKSGGTTETIANFEIFLNSLKKKWINILQQCVVITDEGSKLAILATQKDLPLLFIPKEVGGRYSVFSPVGLFPLHILGIQCEKILEGAQEMLKACLVSDVKKNPALQSAIIHYVLNLERKTISDTFLFHSSFESLGKWYRQLLAESISKELDRDGKVVYCGITPTVSIGSTDLHSMAQLYLGGPRDKITTFVSLKRHTKNLVVPKKGLLNGLVDGIYDKSTSEITGAILSGVKAAYHKKKMPFCEIILDDISPRSLGEFMQFKMMEVMFLGELLNVNAFDQPNVEEYKMETKKLLR